MKKKKPQWLLTTVHKLLLSTFHTVIHSVSDRLDPEPRGACFGRLPDGHAGGHVLQVSGVEELRVVESEFFTGLQKHVHVVLQKVTCEICKSSSWSVHRVCRANVWAMPLVSAASARAHAKSRFKYKLALTTIQVRRMKWHSLIRRWGWRVCSLSWWSQAWVCWSDYMGTNTTFIITPTCLHRYQQSTSTFLSTHSHNKTPFSRADLKLLLPNLFFVTSCTERN